MTILIVVFCPWPRFLNIHQYIGHRFVHQSGLDESSGRKSTVVPARDGVPRLFDVFRNR